MKSLRKRLDTIASKGAVKEGAVSDLGEGKSVHFYPAGVYGLLSEWFFDARKLSIELGFSTISSDLDSVLNAWAGLTPREMAESLCLMDFAVDETVQHVRRRGDNEEGLISEWIKCGDPEEYADPIDARYRFHSMLTEFQQIASLAESLHYGLSNDMMKKDRWTREELAIYLQVKPESVTKMISGYRRIHNKKDPPWVERINGQQRGFKVKVAIFLSQHNAGVVARSKQKK